MTNGADMATVDGPETNGSESPIPTGARGLQDQLEQTYANRGLVEFYPWSRCHCDGNGQPQRE